MKLRLRIAKFLANDPIHHSWDLARYDRIYTDRAGREHILSGSSGHGGPFGFHHGFREGCVVCSDGGVKDTAELPRRFREPEDD